MRTWQVTLLLLLTLGSPAFGQTETKPIHKSKNVIYITWDGFRWQELFGGAQEILIAKDAGVADVEGVKQRYWRETDVERREVLLPFVWKTIATKGQIFGDPLKNAEAKLENTHKFSYPGYSEMFCGFADDKGIDSNKKFPNPHVNVLEFLNLKDVCRGLTVIKISPSSHFAPIKNCCNCRSTYEPQRGGDQVATYFATIIKANYSANSRARC